MIRMKTNDYMIAGHRIRVAGERLVDAIEDLAGFDTFKANPDGEVLCRFEEWECDINAEEIRKDYTNLPELEKIIYVDGNELADSCFGFRKGGGYIFVTLSKLDDSALYLEIEEDGTLTRFSGDYPDYLLKFACWMAYGIAVLPYKTVALHASTILYDGKAVLFLGESGTGKSTHTRLWCLNVAGARMLNDDSPVIRVSDEDAIAYGSPWSGKMHCYINNGYPVAACVRLSQAPYNRIRKLSVHEAFAALHPSCPPPFAYVESLYDLVTDFLSDLLSEVPVYHLEALPDADAARLVCETLFGECHTN